MNVEVMRFNQLNTSEQQVFNSYKSSSFDFNSRIRAGETPDEVIILDALIGKYECNIPMTLYRAVPLRVYHGLKAGDNYQDFSYLSCSIDKVSVYKFCTENAMAILVIDCPIGTHMIDMNINSQFSNDETEFLLPRNMCCKITHTNELNNDNEILDYFDGDHWIADGVQRLIEFNLLVE